MEVNLELTHLAVFFRRHIAKFESLAHRKGIDFNFEIAMNEEIAAKIDQEKCRQIVYNLLSNAFMFTQKGGEVRVKLEIGNSEIENLEVVRDDHTISHFYNFKFQISDNGQGIHPDDQPFIFDRYFQTNQPGKSAEGGTGIGLALVAAPRAVLIWG